MLTTCCLEGAQWSPDLPPWTRQPWRQADTQPERERLPHELSTHSQAKLDNGLLEEVD